MTTQYSLIGSKIRKHIDVEDMIDINDNVPKNEEEEEDITNGKG